MATTAPAPAQNGTSTPTPAAPVSRLGKVKAERLNTPETFVFYGPEGVGKSTLAADAPGVIFADIEDGSSELSVPRYPFRDDPDKGHVPLTYQDVLDMVEDLTVSPHSFRSLAIDSLDRLESLLWKHMLARDSKVSARNKDGAELTSIEDYGFGKGPIIAVEEWRSLCVKLDRLRYARDMQIILVGHAHVKTFRNPSGEDYDRWQLRINDKAAGFLKEWAKVTGYFRFEEDAKKLSKYGRPKGFSTGMRVLQLTRSAAVDAKSRLALPDEILVDVENPWAPLSAAVATSRGINPTELVAQIEAEFARIGDEERAKRARPSVEAALKKQDAGKLQRFLNDLRKQAVQEVA